MKKIKVFLGAYINSTNAQNLNCLALAKNLDKEKFEIYTLEIKSGNLNNGEIKSVNIFRCFYPQRISKYIGYFWGIWKSDVVYLPKIELLKWNQFWLKIFGRKNFSTIESILDNEAITNLALSAGNRKKVVNHYKAFENLYSITTFMNQYNRQNHDLISQERILHLGTDISTFLNENKNTETLENILLIGNDLIRKGIYDYFELAKSFPEVKFHIVGTGNGKISVDEEIEKMSLKNIIYHGGLTHSELVDLLKRIDLHILPSHSEGFPKVTLETAASGVPSIVYSDYGAQEWITHALNGFVADNLSDIKMTIQKLLDHPDLLRSNSHNAITMAKKFDWKVLVKEWEQTIEEVVEK